MKKALKEECFKDGYDSFGKYSNAPHNNLDFMKKLPNCSFGDDKGCRLRTSMYKAYTKGWITAHINSMVI